MYTFLLCCSGLEAPAVLGVWSQGLSVVCNRKNPKNLNTDLKNLNRAPPGAPEVLPTPLKTLNNLNNLKKLKP